MLMLSCYMVTHKLFVCFHYLSLSFTITGNAAQIPIWVANRNDKIVDVIKGLCDRNISAVPVLTKEGKVCICYKL